ncbi:sulfurtransferase [Halomonas glaciei]|uniref:Sulfurtransferase n=2 Tax=Vreelandella TaxID=3137766 RepID=A0A7Z0LRY6_9GAMM|nr:rhodanese-like domain-containing protein [Halomonas glaciei]NYS77456.1 sulfurtransferase [Halomonas glaciei]
MSTQHSAHSVRRYTICLAWISGIVSGVAGADVPAAAFNQQGYRLPPFKAPVTAPLPGVTTLDDDTFQVLLESPSVILVDVYALTWHNGLFLQDSPHLTIPGSIWLPNVGAPTLEDEWRDYFTQTLDAQRENAEAAPLVFFCRTDCWLSWNAARRAEAMGYEELYWYPDGVDGWQANGHSLAAVCPQLPAHAERATCEP